MRASVGHLVAEQLGERVHGAGPGAAELLGQHRHHQRAVAAQDGGAGPHLRRRRELVAPAAGRE